MLVRQCETRIFIALYKRKNVEKFGIIFQDKDNNSGLIFHMSKIVSSFKNTLIKRVSSI